MLYLHVPEENCSSLAAGGCHAYESDSFLKQSFRYRYICFCCTSTGTKKRFSCTLGEHEHHEDNAIDRLTSDRMESCFLFPTSDLPAINGSEYAFSRRLLEYTYRGHQLYGHGYQRPSGQNEQAKEHSDVLLTCNAKPWLDGLVRNSPHVNQSQVHTK